jgi:hypothetical protein
VHREVHTANKKKTMKNQTIPRGYRLKESTHRLIKKVQMELNLSQDKVIAKAVRLYYSSTRSNEISNSNNASKSINK